MLDYRIYTKSKRTMKRIKLQDKETHSNIKLRLSYQATVEVYNITLLITRFDKLHTQALTQLYSCNTRYITIQYSQNVGDQHGEPGMVPIDQQTQS